jgi:hypothetical protein
MKEISEPIDIHDAEWRASVLEQEVERIDEQLSLDPSEIHNKVTHQPMTDNEYIIWSKRAKDALYHKRSELAYLKAWIKRHMNEKSSLQDALALAMPLIIGALPPQEYHAIKNLIEISGLATGTFVSA